MSAEERRIDRATRRISRTTREIGEEFREVRHGAGLSQRVVAAKAGIARSRYTRIEAGRIKTLRFEETARLGAVLGLDLSVKLYPAANPLRDAAHNERLSQLLGAVARPLRASREVPLPARDGGPEQRAWDAVVVGLGMRTAIELEMRLRDGQALERRISLKRRDDPPDRFVLIVAGTKLNRRVLRDNVALFADLPRLRASDVLRALAVGQHPPTGTILL